MYTEDELIFLSDIQHFCFCPRQWQLITLEQLWVENHLTAMGRLLHTRVDDPEQSSRVGNTITMRSVPLVSYTLGLYGLSDAVELTPTPPDASSYFTHPKYPGKWNAMPVEYKRGRPKKNNADKLQLCAQAICLEEMYHITIPQGALFYGEQRHRLTVLLDSNLREETYQVAQKMHQALIEKKAIPPVYSPRCRSCSLINECLPKVATQKSAKSYLKRHEILTV